MFPRFCLDIPKTENKASQPMSRKRLGGGKGSPQRGLLGRCRFWEGSWLDLIVRQMGFKPFFSIADFLLPPTSASLIRPMGAPRGMIQF
jgi:hypothetical protein